METPVFYSIKNFIIELDELFGTKHKPLALYGRLIQHTSVSHTNAISKHISLFKEFVQRNRSAILSKSVEQLESHRINYNDRVYINIKTIMDMSDDDTRNMIWKHLLVLSAYLDPESDAKTQLMKEQTENEQQLVVTNAIQESLGSIMKSDFLTDIFKTLPAAGGAPGGDVDPGKMFGDLMNSPMLKDLVTNLSQGLSDGKFNPLSLMTGLQQATGKEGDKDLPMDMDGMVGMFETMGISRDQMRDMVDKMHNILSEPSADADTETPVADP